MKETKLLIILLFSGVIMSMGSDSTSTSDTDLKTSSEGVGTRARGKALQTDKFPRPPEHAASGTAQPKTKY